MLLEELGIRPEVVEARGYRTVEKAELERLGVGRTTHGFLSHATTELGSSRTGLPSPTNLRSPDRDIREGAGW